MPDIDIDFADRNDLLDKLKHRVAKLDNGKKHNTGVYFTEVPHDPATNLSTLDYDTAEQRKYFKIDCLNVSIYKDIQDEKHLETLMNKEPDGGWYYQQVDLGFPLYVYPKHGSKASARFAKSCGHIFGVVFGITYPF